jgi:membrane-bound lytic murein transglycosylase MltF
MELNQKQKYVKALIEKVSDAVDLSPIWPLAVAMTESSLGVNQKSGTGARGVFQMTSIAMKDLLLEMEKQDDEILDVLCGVAFLHLLMKRWGPFEGATEHFCDPADREFYWKRVKGYMEEFLTQESQ